MADELTDERREKIYGDLTDIRGIGDAKAEEIIAVYEEHGTSPIDQILMEVNDHLEEAIEHFDDGDADVTTQQGIARVRKAYDLLEMEADDE